LFRTDESHIEKVREYNRIAEYYFDGLLNYKFVPACQLTLRVYVDC